MNSGACTSGILTRLDLTICGSGATEPDALENTRFEVRIETGAEQGETVDGSRMLTRHRCRQSSAPTDPAQHDRQRFADHFQIHRHIVDPRFVTIDVAPAFCVHTRPASIEEVDFESNFVEIVTATRIPTTVARHAVQKHNARPRRIDGIPHAHSQPSAVVRSIEVKSRKESRQSVVLSKRVTDAAQTTILFHRSIAARQSCALNHRGSSQLSHRELVLGQSEARQNGCIDRNAQARASASAGARPP